jgi:hypothetical protein
LSLSFVCHFVMSYILSFTVGCAIGHLASPARG